MAIFGLFSPSLVYYAGTPVAVLKKPDNLAEFFQGHPDGFAVVRADQMDQLPTGEHRLVEVTRCRRFLRRYDLVLLGRQDQLAELPSDTERR